MKTQQTTRVGKDPKFYHTNRDPTIFCDDSKNSSIWNILAKNISPNRGFQKRSLSFSKNSFSPSNSSSINNAKVENMNSIENEIKSIQFLLSNALEKVNKSRELPVLMKEDDYKYALNLGRIVEYILKQLANPSKILPPLKLEEIQPLQDSELPLIRKMIKVLPLLLNEIEEELESIRLKKNLDEKAIQAIRNILNSVSLLEKPSQLKIPEEKKEDSPEEADSYYSILNIPRDAPPNEIKAAYYALAKQFHPDKNKGNTEAENKFKLVGEAYAVLSDPERRKNYDLYGKTQSSEDIIMRGMLKNLFGSGLFDDCIGEMEIEFSSEELTPKRAEAKKKIRQKRVKDLALHLKKKIQLWLDGEEEEFKDRIREDVKEKLRVPGGDSLLALIGRSYQMEADMFLKPFSIFGVLSRMFSFTKKSIQSTYQGYKLSQAALKEGITEDIEKRGLVLLWKLGEVEIDHLMVDVGNIFFEEKDHEVRKKMAEGLKIIGDMYVEAGKIFKSTPDVTVQELKERAIPKQ